MSPLLGMVIPSVIELVGRYIPDPEKKAEMQLEVMKLQQDMTKTELEAQVAQNVGQMEINKAEATSESLFKSGWRPAFGWIGAFVILMELVVRPFLPWLMEVFGFYVPPIPSIDSEMFWPLIFGLLGLGGMRTFEKSKK